MTPKLINFPFVPNGKLTIFGVLILTHIPGKSTIKGTNGPDITHPGIVILSFSWFLALILAMVMVVNLDGY